ncbi:MAG: hypothetical protein KOO62_06050 [candidate division Zixibacteria bacterium]|nr:hypothetical protein [candidate division Zixibacteria bacterium]
MTSRRNGHPSKPEDLKSKTTHGQLRHPESERFHEFVPDLTGDYGGVHAAPNEISIPRPEWPKPIIISTRFGPNFLWHMLASAQIGYESDYAAKYSQVVNPQDLAFLRYHGSLLWIGHGEPSTLASSFIYLPSWLKLGTRGDFQDYFNVIRRILLSGDPSPLFECYPEHDWSDPLMKHVREGLDFPADADQDFHDLFRRTAEIFMNSIEPYREQVWPEAVAAMTPRLLEMSEFVAGRDLIAQWEQLLGIEFKADEYEIILCFANKGGSDANSIGYSKNLFYYDKPFDQTCQFLSHEVGSHLLMETYLELAATGEHDGKRLYEAFECLAKFYNRMVLDTKELVYPLTGMDEGHFVPFYEKIYRENKSHRDLMIQAVRLSGS